MKTKWVRSLLLSLLIPIGVLTLSQAFAKEPYGNKLCDDPKYTCYRVQSGDTWNKLFPDPREQEVVKRLNRTNMSLHLRKWIVVPNNITEMDIMDVSPFPDHITAPGEKTLIVNLKLQAFGAYNADGYLVHWGPISGGKGWCPDIKRRCYTITGRNFRIYRKEGVDCVSNKFPVGEGGAEMPYCMFFYGGFALHASTLPGYNDSHGCVRLFFDDAQWLNKSFIDVGAKGTRVIVTNS